MRIVECPVCKKKREMDGRHLRCGRYACVYCGNGSNINDCIVEDEPRSWYIRMKEKEKAQKIAMVSALEDGYHKSKWLAVLWKCTKQKAAQTMTVARKEGLVVKAGRNLWYKGEQK